MLTLAPAEARYHVAMESATTHLVEHIRDAAAQSRPLRIRGGGTKDFYGQNLAGEILDTRALDQIVAYEPSELVVTVGAGTSLLELEQLLAEQGQFLAFEPPHFGPGATVGGMIAAGLSGPSQCSAGPLRDYVLGVQMVNGQAQRLRFGGQVMKNVAGYDVSRLMAGSLGILGLITEVSLKVLPSAVAQATLVFAMEQGAALRQLAQWAARPLPINASWWQADAAGGRLTIRLRGARAAVDAACRDLGGERQDDVLAQQDWQALREQTLGFFEPLAQDCLWRLSVPGSTAPITDLPSPCLVECGGGVRWLKAPASAMAPLRASVNALGGTASIWRHPAAGEHRVADAFHPLASGNLRIQRELKRQFDPAGIFNPGRMFASF